MEKRKMRPKVFFRRYGRIIFAGTVLLMIAMIAIFAPLIATHDPSAINMYNTKVRPNDEFIMGTDIYGRDIFSRVIFGTRISLIVSLSVQTLAIITGTLIGLLAGYYRTVDLIVMRIMEAINGIPTILLSIVLVSVMGSGADKIVICLAIVNTPGIARLVRSQVLSVREKEFIEGALAMGAPSIRIMLKYILPQCFSPLIIRFTGGLASTILTEASLSFLGVGINPSIIPSWGGIISEGRSMVMVYPYMCLFPGIAISITVFMFSMLGDGVRDALDPKLR